MICIFLPCVIHTLRMVTIVIQLNVHTEDIIISCSTTSHLTGMQKCISTCSYQLVTSLYSIQNGTATLLLEVNRFLELFLEFVNSLIQGINIYLRSMNGQVTSPTLYKWHYSKEKQSCASSHMIIMWKQITSCTGHSPQKFVSDGLPLICQLLYVI